jgi:hypothetical protein
MCRRKVLAILPNRVNKIKSISHRSFGFRSAKNFIAAIYHCCARLPLPVER